MPHNVLTSNPPLSQSYLPSSIRTAGIVVAATGLIAVCAHISFPLFFTPVPLSLQPFAVLLVGLLLGPGAAFSALVLYLAEGAAGLPVFTPHGPGGVLQLFGLTGGYLLSYPLVAPFVSWMHRGMHRGGLQLYRTASKPGSRFASAMWSAGIGSLVTLAMGAIWLGVLTHVQLPALMTQAVLPFLPGDALKVVAAATIAAGIQRQRKEPVIAASKF